MTNKPRKANSKPSQKIYQLTVKGTLNEDWRDWFNGLLIATESHTRGDTSTTFTYKVRDQAELIGIINWFHNRNMVIEMVALLPSGSEEKDV